MFHCYLSRIHHKFSIRAHNELNGSMNEFRIFINVVNCIVALPLDVGIATTVVINVLCSPRFLPRMRCTSHTHKNITGLHSPKYTNLQFRFIISFPLLSVSLCILQFDLILFVSALRRHSFAYATFPLTILCVNCLVLIIEKLTQMHFFFSTFQTWI